MEEDNKIPLAEVGKVVLFNSRTYRITDSPIYPGDLVWNEASKSVDRCFAVFEGSIGIELPDGMRAIIAKERFQRLVSERPKCIIVGIGAPNLLTYTQLQILGTKGVKNEDICFVKRLDEIDVEIIKSLQGPPLPALDFTPYQMWNRPDLEYKIRAEKSLKSHHNDKPWYARFDKKKRKPK
jgi:hypothetical protein